MKNPIKKFLITTILLIKITRLKNLNQKNRNLIDCYATCSTCYGEKYNNCITCAQTFMTVSTYDTCDCENNVLYTTTECIDGIKCATGQKVTSTGLCSTSQGESCTKEQILYKCFNVQSNDFPDKMIELMNKEIRFFNSHNSYTYNKIIFYSFKYESPGKKSSNLVYFDFELCKELIFEDFLIDSFNVIVKQEIIEGYTNTISFNLTYPYPITQFIDINEKEYQVKIRVPISQTYIKELDLEKVQEFLNNGIDILNIRDPFYQDFCNNKLYNDVDMNLKAKINEFYKHDDLCSNHTNNCVYNSIINDGGYHIECICNYNNFSNPIYDSSSIQKIVNFEIFKCFTFEFNIGFLLSFLIILVLIVLSIIFCCCEVHYTKSLIYRYVPSNPKKSEINESNIINENEKKDDKVTNNEENKDNKENNENDNGENENENEEKKEEEEEKNEEEKKDRADRG